MSEEFNQRVKDLIYGNFSGFEPIAKYCPDGDFITVFVKNDECVSTDVSRNITTHRSRQTGELAGISIWGIKKLLALASTKEENNEISV